MVHNDAHGEVTLLGVIGKLPSAHAVTQHLDLKK